MTKLVCACALMAAACVAAGIYGMIHNQISFTVSPEYFTQFKFIQFGVAADLRNRWGASLVGWRAAWWMGIVIGGVLVPCGLIIPGWRQYVRTMAQTLMIVMLTALSIGLGALAYASATFTPATVPAFRYPPTISQPLAFARAGYMHTFSYLGGMVGIIGGIIFLLVRRARLRQRIAP